MRSEVLAQHYLLRGRECTKMTLVNFFSLDVQGEMSGQIFFDGRCVIAEIATVGLPVDEGVRIGDVGLVDRIKLVVHTTTLGYWGEPCFLCVLRVVLHVRQQGPFFTAGVLAIFALKRLFPSVCTHVFDQGALGRGGVDADVATERLLSSVRSQMGS